MEEFVYNESDLLKEQITTLKSELALIVSDYELLVNFTCRNILDKYMALVGNSKLELLNTECNTRKLKRKIELIQTSVNMDLPVSLTEIDSVLEIELQEWHIRIKQHIQNLKDAETRIQILESSNDNIEVKTIFRKLVKILHPDINPDIDENYKKLWQRVLESYKKCDLKELQTIELLIEKNEIEEAENDNTQFLKVKKHKLEDSIGYYIKKIESVKNSNPYKLLALIENEDLLKSELDDTRKHINRFRVLAKQYEYILNNLLKTHGGYRFN